MGPIQALVGSVAMHRNQDNRRQIARQPVSLAASALSLSRSRSVVISDLSPEGAHVDGRDLPLPGEDLLLVVGSFDAFAKVMWRTGDRAGIHFDDAVPAESISRMQREAAWESVAGWYR